MKSDSQILIGIALGLIMGLPLGLNFPDINNAPIPTSSIIINAIFGGVVGYKMGLRLLKRSNNWPNKLGVFSFFLIGMFSIGLPTFIKIDNGHLLFSLNLPATFFLSFGLFMAIGGAVSSKFLST